MGRSDLSDLPDPDLPGRSGLPVLFPRAARACRVALPVNLNHMRGEFPKDDLSKFRRKYRNLPDLYWQDKVEAFITPERFDGLDEQVVQQSSNSQFVTLWKLCSVTA